MEKVNKPRRGPYAGSNKFWSLGTSNTTWQLVGMSATILTAEVANGKIKETPGKSALSARVFQVDSVSSIWAQIGLGESYN